MKASLYGTWHSIVQRPHHLSSYLLKTGWNVDLYCGRGIRSVAPSLLLRPNVHGRLMVPSRLYKIPVLSAIARTVNESIERQVYSSFMSSKADLFIQYHRPHGASAYSKDLKLSGPFVYDCMDDWAGFSGADARITSWEADVCDRADEIWVVSRHLEHKLSKWSSKVRYVPNGADYEHFSIAQSLRTPQRSNKRMRLVYVVSILDWFDAKLVGDMATILDEWDISLIGPCSLSKEQMGYLNKPNIHLLGTKPYAELPSLLAQADVAMIPFIINDLIRGTSPIKLYEYLASGIPVIATPMPEVLPLVESGVVACADDPAGFAAAVIELAHSAEPHRCLEIAKQNSWSARFLPAIEGVLSNIRTSQRAY